MNANIKRHSYTNYNGKSYIDKCGIPYQSAGYTPEQSQQYSNQMAQNTNRTIIRNNEPNANYNGGQTNGMQSKKPNHAGTAGLDNQSVLNGKWSNQVRKDNLYRQYAAQWC